MSDNTIIAAEVVSAFVTNNSVPASELPDLIRAVVSAFDNLGKPQIASGSAPTLIPAVPVKKSVHHDYLISLEDGRRYQSLKRHLSALGMTPDQYRAKWGLAADYPMTSAFYSAKRSEMSKSLGLGRKKATEPVSAPVAAEKARSKPKDQAEASAPENEREGVQDAPEAVQEAA